MASGWPRPSLGPDTQLPRGLALSHSDVAFRRPGCSGCAVQKDIQLESSGSSHLSWDPSGSELHMGDCLRQQAPSGCIHVSGVCEAGRTPVSKQPSRRQAVGAGGDGSVFSASSVAAFLWSPGGLEWQRLPRGAPRPLPTALLFLEDQRPAARRGSPCSLRHWRNWNRAEGLQFFTQWLGF